MELADEADVSVSTVRRAEYQNQASLETAIAFGEVFSRLLGEQIDFRSRSTPAHAVVKTQQASPMRILSAHIELERAVLGRSEKIAEMLRSLKGNRVVTLTPGSVLLGGAGIGKSALARSFALQRASAYHGVWWLPSQSQTTILGSYGELATRLGIKGQADDRLTARQVISAVELSGDPWLLIFDNVTNPRVLDGLLPSGEHIHRIITSQYRTWGDRFTPVDVDTLDYSSPESAAVRLLLAESGRSSGQNEAQELAAALGGLPLALVCAGGWLRLRTQENFLSYREKLDEIIRHRPVTVQDYPHSMVGAVLLSIDYLSREARETLNVIAWLNPDQISASDLQLAVNQDPVALSYASEINESYRELATSRDAVENALSELENMSLIERMGADVFRIHRVVQRVVRFVQGEEKDCWFTTAAALIALKYPPGQSGPQLRKHWERCASLHGHVLSLHDAGLLSPAAGYLFNQCNRYLDTRGHYRESARFILRSLRARLAVQNASEIAEGMHNLAIALYRTHHPRLAERFAGKSVNIIESDPEFGDDRRAVSYSLHGITLNAYACTRQGGEEREAWLAKAVKRLQAALAYERKAGSRHEYRMAIRMNNLATSRQDQRRYGAALRLHLGAMNIRNNTLPEDEPERAFGPALVGYVLLEAGYAGTSYRGLDAISLLQLALKMRKDGFPDDPHHPETLRTARWLALAIFASSESLTEAKTASLEALVEEFGLNMADIQKHGRTYRERATNAEPRG
jgi:tetratricopeptide (TPR) repeat protein